jgi:HTH-type transcriptional regulator/antitoxin HigA
VEHKVGIIMNIKPIRNDQDYEEALLMLEALVEKDPTLESEDGDKLSILSTLTEDYEANRYSQTFPSPIDAIEFRMEQANLQPIDLVPYIGSRSKVSEVLSGRRSLSLEMIRALEAGLGIPAKALIQKPEARKGQFHIWTDSLVKEMDKRGYFVGGTFDGKNKESLLAAFFKNHIPTVTQLAWRKTARVSVRTDFYALLSWVEFLENKASSVQIATKYADGTVNLTFMQQVIKFSASENGPLLAQEFLKEHGIVLVVADHLPRTRVDGIAILKDKSKPIIGLSLRFDRVDNFWFTLLHELAHIALHLNREDITVIFDELEEGLGISISEDEKNADVLAQEAIVPASKWAISPAKIIPSAMAAQSLANELGINIAVVAGFIRHKHQNYIYLKQIVHNDNAKVRHLFKNQI